MKAFLNLIVVICFSSYAQEEMSQWHFGSRISLDFISGCAVPVTDSELITVESSSSISSSLGDLRFYTDGSTVYDRDNNIMTDGEGLLSNASSTNGALIVPFPNDVQRYYIFTADAVQNYAENNNTGEGVGINYSVVNMSAQGGLGAVVLKNINLLPEGSEKLTAVRAANGIDYWVLTHYNDRFYAYPITAGGIGSPVISTLGISIADFNNIRGAIKFSPDGSKVAICHAFFEPSFGGQLALYDFNTTTGMLTNERILGDDIVYYGAEFSPNSAVLYASGKIPASEGTGNSLLYQYDLQSSNIAGSRFVIANYESSPLVNLAGLLQLGIDGKIYQSIGGSKLSVVSKPNRLQIESDFIFRSVGVGLGSTSIGLPIGVQSYYDNIIEYDNLCAGDITSLSLNTPRTVSSVLWNFGDPASGPNNTSILNNPTHAFSSSGTFVVAATVTFGDGEVRTYRMILKSVIAPDLIPATLLQCDVDGENDGRTTFNLFDAQDLIFLTDTNTGAGLTLQFYESETDAQLQQNAITNPSSYLNQFNNQVLYTSVFRSLDCFRIVPITLSVEPGIDIPDLDLDVCAAGVGETNAVVQVSSMLGGLLEVYPDNEIRIYPTLEDAGGQTNEVMGAQQYILDAFNELYFRLGASDECIGIGKFTLNILDPLELDDEVIVFCNTEEGNFLSGPSGYERYEWSTGETTQNIEILEAGTYVLEVSLFSGCTGFIQYTVSQGAALEAEVSFIDFSQNNQIIIDATISEGEILYSIDGGNSFQNSGVFSDLAPGTYNVLITDELGCNQLSETVLIRGAPRYFTPNGDGYNDLWHVLNAQDYEGMEIDIFDRFGKRMATLDHRSQGWDGVYNGKPLGTNTYWYSLKYEGEIRYGYFTLIVRDL